MIMRSKREKIYCFYDSRSRPVRVTYSSVMNIVGKIDAIWQILFFFFKFITSFLLLLLQGMTGPVAARYLAQYFYTRLNPNCHDNRIAN